MTALLLLCVLAAKGQRADYSGVYYFANQKDGYSSSDPTNNYYLVPADDSQRPDKRDAYYSPNHASQNGDQAKPFLTTYKTNKDAAAVPSGVLNNLPDNSIWIVRSSGESDYYNIIHASSGKYVVYEVPLPNDPDTNTDPTPGSNGKRKTMHLLETSRPDTLGNIAKFKITAQSTGYKIESKSRTGWYFNPAGGNKNTYYGQNSSLYHGGIVGVYNVASDGGSIWNKEETFCQAPVINFDALAGSYSITWHNLNVSQLPIDTVVGGTINHYTIRYTEDGSDPFTNPNGTAQDYDGTTIVVQQDNTTVKAVVVAHSMRISGIAEQVVHTAVPQTPTFEVTCDSKLQINCEVSTAVLYYNYTTDGTEPTDPDNTSFRYSAPVSMPDNAKVKAIAYNGSITSQVSPVYTFSNNTPSPAITLTETQAEITFGSGVTIHYTTDGTEPDPTDTGVSTSPFTISGLGYNADVEIRVIATSTGHGNSCPETVVKRPKQPTIVATDECFGTEKIHSLVFTDTEEDKTYWYALSNGAGQLAPAHNTFTEYVPGSTVDIAAIPAWNGNDIWVTLHAYAKTDDGFESHVVSEDYMLKYTDAPTITHTGNTVNITARSGAVIRYRINGGVQQTYSAPFTVAQGQSYVITATAQYGSEGESCEAVHTLVLPATITDLTQLNGMIVNGAYVLGNDITGAGSYTTKGTDANPFVGFFDGAGHTISGLSEPLFGTTSNAVIHDVNLKNVEINGARDTIGAIACVAKGYTRIYNCGILPDAPAFGDDDHPTVSTTGNCAGSIVGSLRDDSRVVNCFSYADVSASNSAAGIVGRNQCASDASVTGGRYTKLRTMVVNCMFYGDITDGNNVWPVYGGEKINNGGGRGPDISDGLYAINNYNFYSDSCSFPAGKEPSTTHVYNCSWPAKYEYLTRYEFHRYLLNSNRELCGWWVGAPFAPSTMTTANVQAVPKDASLMAKWVLDRNVAPFPILKPFGTYPSPINIDADASWRESANEWEGKKLGTLSVTVNPGDHAASGLGSPTQNIVITDMDTIHGDYAYRKIQLPYYNSVFGNPNGATWEAKYGGNYGEYAVTGWEVTKVNGSSTGTGDFVTHWQDGYNFADRNSTKKDLYGVSGRIFAQGGYYYVPNDVTNIEITAHWGKAVYLGNGDNYYDRVDFDYLARLAGSTAILERENRPGTAFEPAGTRSSTLGNGQTVHTGKIANVATDHIASGGTVFDNALVLVGNHQYCTGGEDVAPDRSFTIMSADFDLDNEPDYCLEWQLGVGTTRQDICPIRFDFLPVVEIGLGLKKDGSTQYYSLGCYRPKGHFEVTETALIRFGQFEFGNRRTVDCPIILNGGIYDQYVKGTGANNANNDRITYVIIGGNLKMLSFTPGAHVNSGATYSTRHCAVNAIGGRFESLYLSGNFNDAVTPNTDNPHCYIDGGWINHVAAAGKEGIDGDVTFKINHAVIHEFYGGGIMSGHEVTGNIDVTVDNSLVNKYCGGPKFGDMTVGKTVTTRATGTTFGVYYGAGNGGTNYVQYNRTDGTYNNSNGFNWNGTGQLNGYTPGTYRDLATGYQADYDMELINVSTGSYYDCAVNRTYFYAAQYSSTNTGEVTNTLTDCTVKTNFYGAGNLGGVNGNVTSTLTDTKVRGSAFGGGFSASIPKVTIYKKDKQVPVIDLYTGSITPQSGGTSTTYTWSNDESLSTGSPAGDGIFFTEVPLTNLGTVRGDVTLTIQGESVIGTFGDKSTGNVFGGGDESAVTGSTLVKVLDRSKVMGNIYGGGNMGNVGVNTKVIVNGQSN